MLPLLVVFLAMSPSSSQRRGCRNVAVARRVCGLRSSVIVVFVAMSPSLVVLFVIFIAAPRASSWSSSLVAASSWSSSLVAALSLSLHLRLVRRSLSSSLVAAIVIVARRSAVVVFIAMLSLLVVLFVVRCHRRYVVFAIVETTTTLDLTPAVFKRLLEWCDNFTVECV